MWTSFETLFQQLTGKYACTDDPMNTHTFHIPVMGIGFTIDTPIKVSQYGISSVISIAHDALLEQMREFYCKKWNLDYIPIANEIDYRAKRITAYLDLMKWVVDQQINRLKSESFENGTEINKYFRMMPDEHEDKIRYIRMQTLTGNERKQAELELRKNIKCGSIDVNIMTKLDRINHDKSGEILPVAYSDAIAALRGYAQSSLHSAVVFSAGYNPRLFSYLEQLEDFYPNSSGITRKKIIIKVSDFRSASIQGKILAKKGLMVHEFRIESGLNCGGHAFPTEGFLAGPILEEFKQKKQILRDELIDLCNQNLSSRNKYIIPDDTPLRVTYQGGIGTAKEDRFLREYYELDGTGWGSPFLMVPEATNLDQGTLNKLEQAQPEDYFLSQASPLGVPFHNFKKSSSEQQRKDRISKNRPGSPCYRKHLSFNTEFTEEPICTASREYQDKKIKSIQLLNISEAERKKLIEQITAKDCLCEGLAAPALVVNNIKDTHKLEAVAVCPGPNLAYFSGVFTLEDMVDHIYGRKILLNHTHRPHVFINELKLYVQYILAEQRENISEKKELYFRKFISNLLDGIKYYQNIIPFLEFETEAFKEDMIRELALYESKLISESAIEVI